MSVGTFDPNAGNRPLDEREVEALLNCARIRVEGGTLDLAPGEAARFAPLAAHPGWSDQAAGLSDDDLVALIRVFTLGEMQVPGWVAGDASPVIPLVRELKQRGSFDSDLSRWIKQHTTNRFLPHGNLMDRL